MGYYTRYSIDIETLQMPSVDEVALILQEKTGYSVEYFREALTKGIGYSEEIKWYSVVDDMKDISRAYPNVMFRVEGRGENIGDEWVRYFVNGKVQLESREAWTPAPFDLNKFVGDCYVAQGRQRRYLGFL